VRQERHLCDALDAPEARDIRRTNSDIATPAQMRQDRRLEDAPPTAEWGGIGDELSGATCAAWRWESAPP